MIIESPVIVHTIVGAPQELTDLFDPMLPFRACLICGRVYQPRTADGTNIEVDGIHQERIRAEWAEKHARKHSRREHRLLMLSKRFCTPEAAYYLVPLGIAPVMDMYEDEEVAHAAGTAPRLTLADNIEK